MIELGNVGEWLGGVAAAVAAGFAAVEIRRARLEREQEELQRREERHEDQMAEVRAISVNATFDDGSPGLAPGDPHVTTMTYEVHNGGRYPIDEVVLLVAAGHEGDPQSGSALELVIGTVAAGRSVTGDHEVRLDHEPVFGELTRLATLLFTDAWGRHWHRGGQTMEELAYPPRLC